MATNLNKVLLIGNLTREPEQRNAGGTTVCSFGMAINRRYSTARGEQKEETCFVEVDVWGRSADIVMQYVHKGDQLFVEGRLNYDQWDDRATGKKRSRLTVRGENVQLMGNGPRNDANGIPPQQNGGYANQPQGDYAASQQRAYGNNNNRPASVPMPSFEQPAPPAPADNGPVGDDDIPF